MAGHATANTDCQNTTKVYRAAHFLIADKRTLFFMIFGTERHSAMQRFFALKYIWRNTTVQREVIIAI